MKILFVCMGNLCRSPIATAIAMRRAAESKLPGELRFASSGTNPPRLGAPADPRARQIGERRGYDLSSHRTRRVTFLDFSAFDLILAMDRDILATLHGIAPQSYPARLGLFLDGLGNTDLAEVPDPYYGNLAGFERVFDLCEAGVAAVLRACAEGRPLGDPASPSLRTSRPRLRGAARCFAQGSQGSGGLRSLPAPRFGRLQSSDETFLLPADG